MASVKRLICSGPTGLLTSLLLFGGVACGIGDIVGGWPDGDRRVPTAGGVCDPPGADLQAVLDSGEDLLLCPGQTYDLHAKLEYRVAGQSISTDSSSDPREFATLRIANPALDNAISSWNLNGVLLERVIVDGNLVVYDGADNAIWNSGTQGHAGAHLVVQTDGNVVI